MNAFGQPHRRRPDDDQRVMPLINVVFLLLIFFMVAGQLSKTDPVKIDPPVSETEKAPGERRVEVLIAADGQLLLGGVQLDAGDLRARLGRMLGATANRIVHVKADGAADAADVIRVLETIKDTGADKVRLLTSARRGP